MGSLDTVIGLCASSRSLRRKGGAGKTTLALNCAVAAGQKKKTVLILDLDPQSSAEGWYQDREAEAPKLGKLTSWELPEALAKAKAAGFDYVMIDTPGRDEPSTTAAVRASDFCIVPCRPTPVDLKATRNKEHGVGIKMPWSRFTIYRLSL